MTDPFSRMSSIDWERVVSKLLDDTIAGTVEWKGWSLEDLHNPPQQSDICEPIFETELGDWEVRVFAYRHKRYLPDDDEYEWATSLGIEIHNGKTSWRVPVTSCHRDLYNALQRDLSGANEFAEAFLSGSLKKKKKT